MTIKAKRGLTVAAPRCAYVSQQFDLNSTFVLYAGSYGTVVFSSAAELATGLQTIFHPQSGAGYYGTPIDFWISLPQGDVAPVDWYYEDVFNAPGVQIPVSFSELTCYETLTCYSFFFRVTDGATWYTYYLTGNTGTNEFASFPTYADPGYYAALLVCVNTLFGSQASATYSFNAMTNEITMTINNIAGPVPPRVVSTPDFGTLQNDVGTLTAC